MCVISVMVIMYILTASLLADILTFCASFSNNVRIVSPENKKHGLNGLPPGEMYCKVDQKWPQMIWTEELNNHFASFFNFKEVLSQEKHKTSFGV
jgi:hypothetical protein